MIWCIMSAGCVLPILYVFKLHAHPAVLQISFLTGSGKQTNGIGMGSVANASSGRSDMQSIKERNARGCSKKQFIGIDDVMWETI